MSEDDNIGGQSAESTLSRELDKFCGSDSLSEEGLRQIIERHDLTPNNNDAGGHRFFIPACYNERVDEGIIRCLLEYFPDAARVTDTNGLTPLHCACCNKSMTRGIIELLIDAAPDFVSRVDNDGDMPLHDLCDNNQVDKLTAIDILQLLIEKNPEAVRHADNDGFHPIHLATVLKPLEFCQILIEAYPGSVRIGDAAGMLPLHCACLTNNIATVEYLYKLYPDAIYHADTNDGNYPIHSAIAGLFKRANPEGAIETVQYLLNCDPNVKLQKYRGNPLLHSACMVITTIQTSMLHLKLSRQFMMRTLKRSRTTMLRQAFNIGMNK